MTKTAEHYYSYAIDPQGDSTANKVMALVGSEKQVLELGCGPGSLTRFMKEYGRCSIVAVEFDPELAKLAEPFCEQMIVADLETLNVAAAFPEQRFDVIVAADVLEHLRDPWSCLKKIRSVLKPEGYLVVSVPNVTHNALIAQMLQGRFAYADKGLLDRTHLRFFARPDLQDMLLATGYLPAVWERNLAPETTTELTYYWQQLAPAVQQSLQQNIDGQTYQFIVKAYVSDEAGWLASTRIQAEHAVQERDRLERELTEARVKLNEYAKAYQEASARLPELEKSRHEYAEAFQQARDKLFEHEETLKNQSQVIGESRTKIEQLTNEQQTLQQLLYEAKLSLKYWFIQGLRRLKYLKR